MVLFVPIGKEHGHLVRLIYCSEYTKEFYSLTIVSQLPFLCTKPVAESLADISLSEISVRLIKITGALSPFANASIVLVLSLTETCNFNFISFRQDQLHE